ncbi:MAG: hypothetical protein QM564_06865 [Bergeyella sp.]
MNNTAVKVVGMNGLPALKEQSGDLGVSFNTLKFLPPFHFFAKQDHYSAVKIKTPDYLLKHPKRYFLSKKEQEKFKKELLAQNLLYRNKDETSSSPNQNESKSSDKFKPKFQL